MHVMLKWQMNGPRILKCSFFFFFFFFFLSYILYIACLDFEHDVMLIILYRLK